MQVIFDYSVSQKACTFLENAIVNWNIHIYAAFGYF